MKSLLVFMVGVSCTLTSYATEFIEGYIVFPNNDTVKCKFKIGGFISATNFFNKLTVVTSEGEEKVYFAKDKELLAYGVVEKGRRYDYLFVETKVKSEKGFYQRIVDGRKYKLYSHLISSSSYPGINSSSLQYVLFNTKGEFEKFETCLACPWKKQLRSLLKDDTKALEILETASRLNIPKFVIEINKD